MSITGAAGYYQAWRALIVVFIVFYLGSKPHFGRDVNEIKTRTKMEIAHLKFQSIFKMLI